MSAPGVPAPRSVPASVRRWRVVARAVRARRWRGDARRPASRRERAAYAALAGIVLALVGGAYAGWRGWARQREYVQQTLVQDAGLSARLLWEELTRLSAERRSRLLAPVLDQGGDAPPVTADGFASHVERVSAALDARPDPLRGAFVVPEHGGAPELRGAPARDTALGRAVLGAVAARRRLPLHPEDEPFASFTTHLGQPVSIAFARAPRVLVAGRVVPGLVGVVYSRAPSTSRIVEQIIGRVPLLPRDMRVVVARMDAGDGAPVVKRLPGAPAKLGSERLRGTRIVGGVGNASLALRLRTDDGVLLYAPPRATAAWLTGPAASAIGFVSPAGGVWVEAGIDPALAARVTDAAAPASQPLLLGGVLALGALLAGAVLAELRRQRQLADARAAFVSAVSHELRTPLAQICLFSETLLEGGAESDAQARRWLGVINREAHRLGTMVDNVLSFARRERAGDGALPPLAPRACDLVAVADEVAALLAPRAEGRGMTLEVCAPAACEAWVDPGAVRQILINLVDNAVKYGPDGQTVTVRLSAEPGARGGVTLRVSDEGPGIAPHDRARVLRPFERAVAAGSAVEGSGLGLSVVSALVRGHGGRLRVEAVPGGGASVVVELPNAPAGADAARA